VNLNGVRGLAEFRDFMATGLGKFLDVTRKERLRQSKLSIVPKFYFSFLPYFSNACLFDKLAEGLGHSCSFHRDGKDRIKL
jgi:hypothetical protein